MDRIGEGWKRRLKKGLRNGRMGVEGEGKILRRKEKLNKKGKLVDNLKGIVEKDMREKKKVCRIVREDFEEKVSMKNGEREEIGSEREIEEIIVDKGGIKILLGIEEGRKLRMGIKEDRNEVEIKMKGMKGNDLGKRNELILGIVWKNWKMKKVENGVNELEIGEKMIVDRKEEEIIERKKGLMKEEEISVRKKEGRDKKRIGLKSLGIEKIERLKSYIWEI